MFNLCQFFLFFFLFLHQKIFLHQPKWFLCKHLLNQIIKLLWEVQCFPETFVHFFLKIVNFRMFYNFSIPSLFFRFVKISILFICFFIKFSNNYSTTFISFWFRWFLPMKFSNLSFLVTIKVWDSFLFFISCFLLIFSECQKPRSFSPIWMGRVEKWGKYIWKLRVKNGGCG